MGEVIWHKVSEYDFPQPFKKVLLFADTDTFYLGWYEGETRRLSWYLSHASYYVSSKHIKAWCELPSIPKELMG